MARTEHRQMIASCKDRYRYYPRVSHDIVGATSETEMRTRQGKWVAFSERLERRALRNVFLPEHVQVARVVFARGLRRHALACGQTWVKQEAILERCRSEVTGGL